MATPVTVVILTKDEAITKPFATPYGFHIVKRLGVEPVQMDKSDAAYVYEIKPDTRYASLFTKLYTQARQNRRGLWKNANDSLKKERKNGKSFQWFNDS